MKFICTQSDLNTNLSLVSRAVSSRPTHPVLGNVLLVADKETQKIHLTGFDLSLGIRTSLNAEVKEAGKLTLPAKLFNDIVSRLPEGEITLIHEEAESGGEETLTTLNSASGRFQIRGMEADEFPALPTVEDGESLVLPVSVLLEGLRGAAFAASTDETKQVLTGVHLRAQTQNVLRNILEFAATDGHRLAVVQTPIDLEEEDAVSEEASTQNPSISGIHAENSFPNSFALTIPARALRELERMLNSLQSTDTLTLCFNEAQVLFELDSQCLTSRKLDGAYPAYEQLIPHQFSRQITVERKRLINSLELVAVLADQKNNIAKFTLDSELGQLSLSVEAKDVGNAKESMPAEIIGESTEIAFNIKYLMDGLKALSTNDIKMQLNEWNQPVIFTPLGGLQMTYLVMPVQIRS